MRHRGAANLVREDLSVIWRRFWSLSLLKWMMLLWLAYVAISTGVWVGGAASGIELFGLIELVIGWLIIGAELIAVGVLLEVIVFLVNRRRGQK